MVAGDDYSEHKLIMGTHTSGDEPNYLLLAKVLLPSENATLDETNFDEEKGGEGAGAGEALLLLARVAVSRRRAVAPSRRHCSPPARRSARPPVPRAPLAQSWVATR